MATTFIFKERSRIENIKKYFLVVASRKQILKSIGLKIMYFLDCGACPSSLFA